METQESKKKINWLSVAIEIVRILIAALSGATGAAVL